MQPINLDQEISTNDQGQQKVTITQSNLQVITAPLSDKILFVGTGECGGKNALEMFNRGYVSYFVNTAPVDLDAIPVDQSMKFYIPNAMGCNKDRDLGKEYGVKYYDKIANTILMKFKGYSHIVVTYSMGGGTGSSIALMIMQAITKLTQHLPPKDRPVVIPWQVCASPEEKSQQVRKNVVECYNDFTQLEGLGMTLYTTNKNYSNTQKEKVNVVAAETLLKLFELAISNDLSNIDQYEILRYMAIPGVMMMCKLEPGQIPNQGFDGLKPSFGKIFAPPIYGAKYLHLIYSLKAPEYVLQAEQAAEKIFGIPQNTLIGYNGKENLVFAFGLPFNVEDIMNIAKQYQDFEKETAAHGRDISLKPISMDMNDSGKQKLTPKSDPISSTPNKPLTSSDLFSTLVKR